MRLFVVKVYGPKCEERFMNEINVLKVLKNHPNVGQLLAVRKLDGKSMNSEWGLVHVSNTILLDGSTLAVQPYYENTDRWYQDYHKDLFPPVFVQLAKVSVTCHLFPITQLTTISGSRAHSRSWSDSRRHQTRQLFGGLQVPHSHHRLWHECSCWHR